MASGLPQRISRIEPPLRSPRHRNGQFVNYAKTISVDGLEWATPATEDEAAKLVGDAAADRRRVKVVGAGHSWSSIAAPEDVAVSFDRLSGISATGPGWVRVGAGTRLRHLYRDLAERDLALPIVASIAQQSVAGATATGTHGSSLVHGNLSSLVIGARVVAGDGSIVEISGDDDRIDAVRVHLGALGALTEVTLRTVPAFNVVQSIEQVPVQRVGSVLEEIGRSAEYAKVWWMPHTADALVFRYERTGEHGGGRPYTQRFVDNWLPRGFLHPVWEWHRHRSGGVPALNRVAVRWLVKPPQIGPSSLMLATPEPIRHHETEAAVPLEHSGEAFDRTVALIERLRLHVNFILEARFVPNDSAWMSTAYGRDVVHLGACTAITGSRHEYFKAFWAEMKPLGGRPHWAKEMAQEATEIRAMYPMAERFLAVRDELDPNRVFGNTFLDRILGRDEAGPAAPCRP
jgi:FAD/FMN-containing dehydrogenase